MMFTEYPATYWDAIERFAQYFIPKSLPDRIKNDLLSFYKQLLHNGLSAAYNVYGAYPVEHDSITAAEYKAKYSDERKYNDDTMSECADLVMKDIQPPEAWGYDYVNCDTPENFDGFWEMYDEKVKAHRT